MIKENSIMKRAGRPLPLAPPSPIRLFYFSSLRPYFELMRPPNLWTAVADIFAGYAVAGLPNPASLFILSVSTIGLYGGGVVLNDLFDAKLDRVERPERPIPSGRASTRGAALLALSLFSIGIGAAFMVGSTSGLLAIGIAASALLYDTRAKHFPIIGPINMGFCRGLNLLLGVSVHPSALLIFWPLALVPWTYIAAITLLSKGEVHGGRRSMILLSSGMIAAVLLALSAFVLLNPDGSLWAFCFLALLAIRLLPRFRQAYQAPEAQPIRMAVKEGVLSLIFLDAAIAALFVAPFYPLLILAFRPMAIHLAKRMAVT